MRISRLLLTLTVVSGLVAFGDQTSATAASPDMAVASPGMAAASSGSAAVLSPEDTVRQYLRAMQEQKYDQAYKYISKGMAGNKDAEAWTKEQKYIMQTAEVKIFKFEVFPAKSEGDKIKVPNILSSQDKFLNQLGADEYELYTLVKENGGWKIDQQELVEKSDQAKWFTKPGS